MDEIRLALTLLGKIHRLQMRKSIFAGHVDLAELDEARAAVCEDVLSDPQVALGRRWLGGRGGRRSRAPTVGRCSLQRQSTNHPGVSGRPAAQTSNPVVASPLPIAA